MMMKKTINGIVLVNKTQGLTSNAVLQRVKRLFQAKKAGHTGSLDPLATGMLPICLGEATKISQFLLDADKCYEVTGLLGIKTNTGDAMGEVVAKVAKFTVSEDQLKQSLLLFRGLIKQVPPMFSALKHHGKPLYKLARAGIDVERKARDVSIHQLELNYFDGAVFKLTVSCSKGTYIRSLVEDIGEHLGVGAHVTELHRRYTAGFNDDIMFTLEQLAEKNEQELYRCLWPMERAVSYLPMMQLSSEQVTMLYLGQVISTSNSGNTGILRLYEKDNEFIGLGELDDEGTLKVKRLLSR